MRDSEQYESPRSRNIAPALMIIMAAAMIGGSFGILVADRGVLHVLKNTITGRTAIYTDSTVTKSPKPETQAPKAPEAMKSQSEPEERIIQTGLSSISAIHYSPRSDSDLLTFDLEAANLVGTGELSSPDRVYIDLQDDRQKQGASGLLKAQKAVPLDGDLVAKARIAQWESGATRIVLDLKRSCRLTYQIPPDDTSHLIVELRPRAATSAPKSARSHAGPQAVGGKSHWIVNQYPN